jgi:hypothetical protein
MFKTYLLTVYYNAFAKIEISFLFVKSPFLCIANFKLKFK